jgi:tetratricopeptide (TPR) repeat protein
VLRVLPTHAAATFALGLMAAKRGQTVEATRLLKKGLEGDPDYFPSLFLLAEIEAGQGQFEQAIEHYQLVAKLAAPRREGIEARRRLPGLEADLANRKIIEVGLLAQARKYFNEGTEAFQQQDFEAAFKAFSRATVLDEKNPYYVFNRGLAAFNLGNNVVAAESFERVITLAPTLGLPHFWLGVMFEASAEQARDAGNLLEAQAEYKAVVEKLDLAIRYGAGAWYLDEAQKRRAESRRFLDQQQEGFGYLLIGGVLVAQARFDEALNVFTLSAKRFPYDYQPWLNIGTINRELKRYDEAKAALDQAIKVNPNSPKPYMEMGFLFETQERLDDAVTAYRKVSELIPAAPEPHEALGAVLMQKDRMDEAVQEFERAVELSGGTATARVHYSLSTIYGQRGQRYLALQNYRKTRDLLADRTEPEAVDIRRASEDNIATLEEQLRPYRFTFTAKPWVYDSNIYSTKSDPTGEAYAEISATIMYYLVNDPAFKLIGTLSHDQTYYFLVLDRMSNTTSVGAQATYVVNPVTDISASYDWNYAHGTEGPSTALESHGPSGPQSMGQSLSTSITRRGQLPSSSTLNLSYSTSEALGRVGLKTASLGYSASLAQQLGDAGTVTTSFAASSFDSTINSQISQGKSLNLRYSRRLWNQVSASLIYVLSFTDFVNPFQVSDPTTGQRFSFPHTTKQKSYGFNLTHSFRNDLDLSLNMSFVENESNLELGGVDPDLLRNDLVRPPGSFHKRILTLQVSKTF